MDAVMDFYRRDNANPGRTLHTLARRADADYEDARQTAARFINAADPLEHEKRLVRYALDRLRSLPGLRILGPQTAADRISVFSFVLEGVAPQDIVASLDAKGIAIRGGDLASLPLLERLGVTRAARASFYLYSTTEEVDRLVEALSTINGS